MGLRKVGNKAVLFCSECKIYQKEAKGITKENIKPTEHCFDPVEDTNLYAVYNHICSKCGHDKAQILEKGTYYSDEDTIFILKCGKCGHCQMADGIKP